MRNVIIFSACLFIASGFGLSYCHAQEEELKCFTQNVRTNPALSLVETVYIAVDYKPFDLEKSDIPDALSKATIEETAERMYRNYFTVKKGMRPGCLGINNQPVRILDYSKDLGKFKELHEKPENLMVLIQARIHPSEFMGKPEGHDIMSIYVHHLRADTSRVTDFLEIPGGPKLIPLSLDDASIRKYLERYFRM